MTPQEWLLLVAFVGAVWGISLLSPDAAAIFGGFVAITLLIRSGAIQRITSLIGG